MQCGDPNEIAVEERGREGEGEEGAVGGRNPEAHEGEDGQGDDRGRRSPPHGHGGYRGGIFGGADVRREPHGLDPPEPNPMLVLGSLVDALRMAGLRANPRRV